VALLETIAPRRRHRLSTPVRWAGNFAVAIVGAAGAALISAGLQRVAAPSLLSGFGVPLGLEIAAGIVLLDLVAYILHRVLHAVPLLWRLHALHHADPELDLATAVRHHPLEAWAVALLQFPIGVALGLSPAAIAIYGTVVIAMQIILHANLTLPAWVERPLSRIFVTPDLHSIHHSVDPTDGNCNFADILSLWDRLFGTFRATPAAGFDAMTFGLTAHRAPSDLALHRMLALPATIHRAARGEGL
jgi:sterol desaturase/sphingolipid hydroxylase (fatty acid hydroxylase superfamily)